MTTYLVGEVLFDDFVSQFINLHVFVVLQTFNLVEAATFFNHGSDNLQFWASQLENVVDAV